MNDMELICFQIISNSGTAKSSYIEAIQKAKQKDFEAAEKLLNLLFGKEQAKAFLSHLDDGDDFIDTEVLFADIKSIFESNKDLKKS